VDNICEPLAPENLAWEVGSLGLSQLGCGRGSSHYGHIQLELSSVKEFGIGELEQRTGLIDDMAHHIGP